MSLAECSMQAPHSPHIGTIYSGGPRLCDVARGRIVCEGVRAALNTKEEDQ